MEDKHLQDELAVVGFLVGFLVWFTVKGLAFLWTLRENTRGVFTLP